MGRIANSLRSQERGLEIELSFAEARQDDAKAKEIKSELRRVRARIADVSETADAAAASEGADADYDPGDHTVDEVKAYVAEHPEDLEGVLAAELNGKQRQSLLSFLDEFDEEPDGAE